MESKQETPLDGAEVHRKARFGRTRKVIGHATGYYSYKKNAEILKHRLSFPLARQMFKREVEGARSVVPVGSLNDTTLWRTIYGHRLIMIVMAPLFLWALICAMKGIAAGVRFEVWSTNWLITGVPLAVLTAVRLRNSWLACRLCQEELQTRSASSREPKA